MEAKLSTENPVENLNRKEFLTLFGTGAAALLGAVCLGGCATTKGPTTASQTSTSTPSASAEGSKPLTLDLSSAAAADLDNASKGYVYLANDSIVVAKTTSGEYIALGGKCTHEGGPVEYSAKNNDFVCPWHNSRFDYSGAVTRGAARRPLRKYTVVRNGNTLQIVG